MVDLKMVSSETALLFVRSTFHASIIRMITIISSYTIISSMSLPIRTLCEIANNALLFPNLFSQTLDLRPQLLNTTSQSTSAPALLINQFNFYVIIHFDIGTN